MTKFYLDTHSDKNGEFSIRVSVRAGGRRLMTSIGYSISKDKWNGAAVIQGTKKNPVTNARGIPAATINERIAAITAAFLKIEATPGAATLEAYQAALDKITGKAPRTPEGAAAPEVLAAFDAFLAEESRANQWTSGTLQCWHAFRGHLLQFNPGLKFSDLDERCLAGFVDYLRCRAAGESKAARAREAKSAAEAALEAAESPEAREKAAAAVRRADRHLAELAARPEGLEEKTAQKHYSNLKWFIGWCIRRGLCDNRTIESYRPKFKVLAKPVIFLTRPELLKLYSYEIPANGTKVRLTDAEGNEYEKTVTDAGALAKTRDLFCFCAFTSLRYSDMAALKRTDVRGNVLTVTTQKTNDRIEIPLNNYSRAILEKYEGLQDPAGLALPVISNQRMNDYIKDLCELCGFNEPVTKTYFKEGRRFEEVAPKWQLIGTHAARRTFICYALTKGIPPQVIMKFTGHSDYSAMKPYIDIAATDAAKAMQLMND